ncbi:TrkA family potassium uptake protein [Clostridium butyricum]|jgi:trk system potassium uptake protein TrkA|uniref:NAD(P)-binding domain-containing protein n=1 Tax=Clostridium butyricum TaxID=1492 RepID=A0A2S7FEN6_CLOBU|nr:MULTISPECIES: TrkA family potassium uptake protein [Clostridium]ETI88900.1 MAG: TrkA-N [Clostridium butyricum DORA_1]KHD15503.1 potassium transporter TrkA [Clostridium butyricum]MDK2827490.1 trk/ktr system potassium uptake protein [Clostridium butyricum]MDU1509247.1 TrkA family potassium uptake protein [Clostridium butyricum]MDU4658930.1 TrkA family potassium uptake protein [Clostridium butyricum]
MKSVLIIGIGRFGRHLARKFVELGNEVMIVDIEEEKMSEIVSIVTTAQIGDCTNVDVLKSLGVRNFDICFVCIGDNFQASLEITSLLKELGAKHVVSKANREIHAKFLLRNGADDVVYPEKDIAEKAAIRYSADHVFDYIELTPEYSIAEIPPVSAWIGKTIAEISVRGKYQMSILATKENGEILPLPKADHVFREEEHLIVAARKNDLVKLIKKI